MAQEILRKATEDEILREQAIAREKFEHDIISIRSYAEEVEKKWEKTKKRMEEREKNRQESEKDREKAEKDREKAEKDREKAEKDRDEARKELQKKEQALAAALQQVQNAEDNLRETVVRMNARNMSDDEISDITGASIEKIIRILNRV